MVDSTDNVAGSTGTKGPIITCILDEGAVTFAASGAALDQLGQTVPTNAFASTLQRGNMVAISNDVACTWAATGGRPVMEKAVSGETLVIGRIVTEPKLIKFAASTAVADTLVKRLAAGYHRVANVEIYGGITAILKAEVYLDGTSGFEVGQTAKLKHNLTGDYADDNTIEIQLVTAASGGVGIFSFHYAADGTAADTVNALVGINAPVISLTGA
ncbi:MAG: hypothetical protein KAJ03_01795 [Gammaproteobacteria bacterium]|nr:hypothetical protein [Gammaproteobacteria bacterium]